MDRERHALSDLQEHIRAFDMAANSEGPQGQHFQQQHNRATATNAARMAAATLRNTAPENSLLQPTPLDALLTDLPCSCLWSEKVGAQRPPEPLHMSNTSEMFLWPAAVPTGEKVLRIVDYVDSIIPRDEEHVLSNVGTTKIYVSYGRKKIKLEQVSFQQWVVANTHIFYSLLSGGKFPSLADIQHYLAYTVKVMELSSKYSWVSVLRYDDEFCKIQAVYNYPWNYNSNHLHTVLLEPLSIQGGQTKVGGSFGSVSLFGR